MRLRTKDDRIAYRQLFIPKDAHCVTNTEQAAVYVYKGSGERVGLVCFRGSAGKPEKNYTFKNIDAATAYAAEWLNGVQKSVTFRANRRAEKRAWQNGLRVGDILYTSWGYDQTNVDFFIVTRVSGKRTWVRPIAQDSEATGPMAGQCWPAMPIRPFGDESMHIAQGSGNDRGYLNIDGHGAWLLEGQAKYFSTYA